MENPVSGSSIAAVEAHTAYDKLLYGQPIPNAHAGHPHHHHHHNPLKMLGRLFKKKTDHAAQKKPALPVGDNHSDNLPPPPYTKYESPPPYTQWALESGDPPAMPPLPKKPGIFARLFAHDHSKGSQGALVVEGVDEGVHPFSNAAATAHLAGASPPAAGASALGHLQALGSASLHDPIGVASIAIQAPIGGLIGPYTVAISAHEMHEEKHAAKEAAEQIKQFEASARKYDAFLEGRDVDKDTGEILAAISSGYTGLLPHLKHMEKQAKTRFRFWGSSLTSGAAATTNSAAVIGTTAAGTATAGVVGGTAAVSLPLVGGAATTALGYFHTKGARRDRDYLRTVAPVVLDTLNAFEKSEKIKSDPRTVAYAYFLREKFLQRDNANKRDVRWGKVFTGGAAAGTTGAFIGGVIGFGVGFAGGPAAPGTVPVCTAVGAAIGGAGGLTAAVTAPILPIRHTKNGRHERCAKLDPAKPDEVQEAVFRAAADILEPEESFLLRAKEFDDNAVKNRRTQEMLNLIAESPSMRKSYQPKKHKSDIPSAAPLGVDERPAKLRRKLRESDIRRFAMDPQNFSAVCEYMCDQIAVDTKADSALRAKIELERSVFGKLSNTDEVVDVVRADFQDAVQGAEKSLVDAESLHRGFSKLLAPANRAPSEDWQRRAMRVFLNHTHGIEPYDIHKGIAEHLHESGKRDREERERIFHKEWRAGLMKLQGEQVPADGKAAKTKAQPAFEHARDANRRVNEHRENLNNELRNVSDPARHNYFDEWDRDWRFVDERPENDGDNTQDIREPLSPPPPATPDFFAEWTARNVRSRGSPHSNGTRDTGGSSR